MTEPVKVTEPLVVRNERAFEMLGVSRTHGFKLKRAGILEAVPLGKRANGISMRSIKRFVEAGFAKE